VVSIAEPHTGRPVGFVKIEIEGQPGTTSVGTELLKLKKVSDCLQSLATSVQVPRPLGSLRVGKILYRLESAAPGTMVARTIRRPGYYKDWRKVQSDFVKIARSAAELTEALQLLSGVRAMDAGWHEVPMEFRGSPELCEKIKRGRYFSRSFSGSGNRWIQHGDLSVENVFLDAQSGRVQVIDWDDLAGGLPPLYDLFTLFYSTGYLAPADERVKHASEEERWVASFNATFFGGSDFSRMVGDLMTEACERLKVAPDLVPCLLLEFLLTRAHYYRSRNAAQCHTHLKLLEVYFEPAGRLLFGRFPLA